MTKLGSTVNVHLHKQRIILTFNLINSQLIYTSDNRFPY